jgi:hypothetical protein
MLKRDTLRARAFPLLVNCGNSLAVCFCAFSDGKPVPFFWKCSKEAAMRYSVSGPALIAALIPAFSMVQGCTVSDTLTPPLDVGTSGSISNSAPLTHSDMQTAMAQNQSVYASPTRQQEADSTYSYPQAPPGSAQDSPQNSLEAQAQALQSGYNPVASAPLDGSSAQHGRKQHDGYAHQPVENQRSLHAQSQATYEPAPAQEEAMASTQTDAESPATESHSQAAIAPDPAASDAIRFLPIIGAPSNVVMPLSRQLGMEAREKGLVLRDSSSEPAQHILKGYFSAYSDGNRTVVVYVWDVLDASGNRLHRIQGQETVPGKAKDPWASVPASTMQTIATKTMDDYQEWRSKSTG